MSTGLLDCLLNTQSKTAIPAGQKMQVVMIDRGQLHRNPDNQIYIIGDVSRLKERYQGKRDPAAAGSCRTSLWRVQAYRRREAFDSLRGACKGGRGRL